MAAEPGPTTRRASIRARTSAAVCAVLTVSLVIGAFLLVAVMRGHLIEGVDDGAETQAEDVAALLRRVQDPAELAVPNNDDSIVQVVDRHGTVLVASQRIDDRSAIVGFRPRAGETEIRNVTRLRIPGSDHTAFRVVAHSATGPTGAATVYVATDLEAVHEAVDELTGLLLIWVPLLLVLVSGTCWFVVGRALRPVETMRRDLAVISPENLDHRVASTGNDDEIARLAQTLNDTLARLESFTDRQQRFVADASHELQSPLASSIAELELALADPEQCDWPATASDLLTEQQRMTRLVQDLLFLARDDDGVTDAPQTLIDLDDVVRSEAARLRPRTTAPIDTSAVVPVEVRGGAEQLARVVRNLLENAVRYAATRVTVTLATDEQDERHVAVLTVADDGPGVPAAARERIFERFGRADESRARGTGGTGLGLSIARRVAERHGGAITLDSSDAVTRFVLVLPLPSRDRIGR